MIPSSSAAKSPQSTSADPNWWRQAAVYQIYPRSFYDANGDGLGDIAGITAKVPYLMDLGVDAVWLSPFYPSELADGGYDVADYRNVDPRLGTLSDFDAMTAALHDGGLKVVVDIVPNHSSDQHAWFQEALLSPQGSAARDRYIFRDGHGANGELPPSDWTSVFGGPAWTRVPDGQWYLHLFASEQPDFNWANSEVRDDFLLTLKFWSDRGVDGFRIDVAHALVKDLSEPLPSQAEIMAMEERHDGSHPFWDRDAVHEIYAQWRTLFNQYDPPRTAVAEAWVHHSRRARYATSDGLGQAFNFDLLVTDFTASSFASIVRDNLAQAQASGASSTWVLSNHDVVRHATRYGLPAVSDLDVGAIAVASAPAPSVIGEAANNSAAQDGLPSTGQDGKAWLLAGAPESELNRELGLRRARAATLFMLGLPGSAYLYQGEELGLHEVGDIADADRADPTFLRNTGVEIGRDGCRVPLPWDAAADSFGFSTAPAHIPAPAWFADVAVSAQVGVSDSTLTLYQEALALRHSLQATEELHWVDTHNSSVLEFVRPNGWRVVTNFGEADVELPPGKLVLSSVHVRDGKLPGAATAWLV